MKFCIILQNFFVYSVLLYKFAPSLNIYSVRVQIYCLRLADLEDFG